MFSYIQLPKYRLIYDWSFSEVCDSGSELDLQRNCQAKGGKRALLWNHDSIAKEGRVSLFCPFQSPTCPWITQGKQKSSKEEAARAAGMGPWCLSLKHKKKVLAYTELLCLQLSLNTYTRRFFVFSFFCFFFLTLENAFILEALISITAFRIRWSIVQIQESWGVFLFVLFNLFVVTSLT